MLERNFEFIYGARSFRSRFMLKVREWMFDDGSKGSERMFFYLPGPASLNNSILRASGHRQFRRLVRYAKWNRELIFASISLHLDDFSADICRRRFELRKQ